jgi:hypothetical protein
MSVCPDCGFHVKVASANKTRKGGIRRHKSHFKNEYGILEPGFERRKFKKKERKYATR